MKGRYRLTSRAELDVTEIWVYIAKDNIAAADRLIDRFTETYELLSSNPEMGSRQKQYREGLRSFSVGNYIVFYQNLDDGLLIYRVLHGARILEELL